MISLDNQYSNSLKNKSDNKFKIESITSGTGKDVKKVGNGKGLICENPYITQEQVNYIYNTLKDVEYMPLDVKHRGNPYDEFGKCVEVENKQNENVLAFISVQDFNFNGGLSVELKCKGKSDKGTITSTVSPTQRRIDTSVNILQASITNATELINGANGGIFKIIDNNGDGTNDGFAIFESGEVTSNSKGVVGNFEGIGLTKDGGKTYQNAITHEGIVADAVTTGTLQSVRYIALGEQTFFASEYNQVDYNRVQSIILGTIQPTPEDYVKYDMFGSGEIDITDLVQIQALIIKAHGDWLKNKWGFYITPNSNEVFKIIQTLEWADGESTDYTRFEVRSGKTYSDGINVKNQGATVKLCDNNSNYAIDVMGKDCYTTGTWVSGSLEKNKKNFELCENTTEIVKNSDVYKYNLKFDKDTDKKHFGLVIGDNYRTPTEILSKNNDGVDTYSMCSVLWKCTQECIEKIEYLEVIINEQNEKIMEFYKNENTNSN